MTFQKSESLHVIDSFMETTDTHFTKDCSLDPSRPALLLIDVQPNRPKTSELPALAFGSHYSVFKERPGTHHYCRCWCRVSEGLFRTDFSAGKSPAAVGGPLGSRSDGMVTVAVARVTVNALPGCGRCLGTAHAAAPDGLPELYRARLRTPRIADALRETGSAPAHRYRRDGPRWPTDLASTCR